MVNLSPCLPREFRASMKKPGGVVNLARCGGRLGGVMVPTSPRPSPPAVGREGDQKRGAEQTTLLMTRSPSSDGGEGGGQAWVSAATRLASWRSQ